MTKDLRIILVLAILLWSGENYQTLAQLVPNSADRDGSESQRIQQENLINRAKRETNSETYRNDVPVDKQNSYKRGKAIIKPSKTLADKYAAFLKTKGAGIVSLLREKDCNSMIVYTKSNPCSNYPPDSSLYSFVSKTQMDKTSADLNYSAKGINVGFSDDNLGVLVELGEVAIEEVNLSHPKIYQLSNLYIPNKRGEISNFKLILKDGFKAGGIIFKSDVRAEKKTFAIRSVIYRGANKTGKSGDVLTIFQIIDCNNENITFLFKELTRQSAPKIIN